MQITLIGTASTRRSPRFFFSSKFASDLDSGLWLRLGHPLSPRHHLGNREP
jgi:hypothetical protein